MKRRLLSRLKPDYQRGGIKLYFGDCRSLLSKLAMPALVITDPPYIVHAGESGGCYGNRKSLADTGGFTDGGCDFSFLDGFSDWFCFCSRRQLRDLLGKAEACQRFNLLMWQKTNPLPTVNNKYLPDVEFIVHGLSAGRLFGDIRLKSTVFRGSTGYKETDHPNEKPVKLCTKLVLLGSKVGELVCDPFMGSGTVGVSCVRTGRRFVGIECDRKWFDVAAERIDRELDRGSLFHDKPIATALPRRRLL